jgi:hypothetical protein
MSHLLIAAAEPSKVPFYVAGCLLAAWAVVLAAVGLTRPSFPTGARAERGVVSISLVLMVAAVATAILTSR